MALLILTVLAAATAQFAPGCKIALLSVGSRTYVRPDASGYAAATGSRTTKDAQFTVVYVDDGQLALRSWTGTFLSQLGTALTTTGPSAHWGTAQFKLVAFQGMYVIKSTSVGQYLSVDPLDKMVGVQGTELDDSSCHFRVVTVSCPVCSGGNFDGSMNIPQAGWTVSFSVEGLLMHWCKDATCRGTSDGVLTQKATSASSDASDVQFTVHAIGSHSYAFQTSNERYLSQCSDCSTSAVGVVSSDSDDMFEHSARMVINVTASGKYTLQFLNGLSWNFCEEQCGEAPSGVVAVSESPTEFSIAVESCVPSSNSTPTPPQDTDAMAGGTRPQPAPVCPPAGVTVQVGSDAVSPVAVDAQSPLSAGGLNFFHVPPSYVGGHAFVPSLPIAAQTDITLFCCSSEACDVVVAFYRCDGCATSAKNGGLPVALELQGWSPGSCAPSFAEAGSTDNTQQPMVAFHGQLEAGLSVVVPLTVDAAVVAIFATPPMADPWCAIHIGPVQTGSSSNVCSQQCYESSSGTSAGQSQSGDTAVSGSRR